MRSAKHLIPLIILAALAAFYYLYEMKGGEERQRKEELAKKVFSLKAEQVEGLSLKREKEEIVLKRKDGGWALLSPVEALGDKEKVKELLDSALELKRERLISEGEKLGLKEYGLSEPRASLKISPEKGGGEILLGDENPTGSGLYAFFKGERKVFLVDPSFRDKLRLTLYDLRDKAIVPLDWEDVTRLEVRRGSLKIRAEKKGEDWQLREPLDYPADNERIGDMLWHFLKGKVVKFIAEGPKDLSPYGLEQPSASVAFFREKGEGAELLLGDKYEEDKTSGVYAKLASGQNVFLVEEKLLEDVPEKVFDIRSKVIFSYDTEKVERLALKGPSGEVLAERGDGDRWRLKKPLETRGDKTAVEDILWALKWAKVKGYLEGEKKLGTLGLEPPRRSLSFWLKGEKEPKTLLIGEKEGKTFYAKRKADPVLFLLSEEDLAKFFKSAKELRDRRLFAFEDLSGFELLYPKRRFLFESGEVEWKLKAREGEELDPNRILDLAIKLKYIRFEEIPREEELPQGLDFSKPAVTALLRGIGENGEKKLEKKLELRSEGERLYGRVDGKPPVYLIDKELFKDFPLSAEALLEE